MRVVVCIPCLLTGGTEVQTLNLVQALVEGGHEVVTVCYFEYSSVMVERFRLAGSRVELLSADGSRPGGWRMVRFLYEGLRRVVRREKPDVAHVQYMAPGAIPIVLLRLMRVKCVIATAHTAGDIYSRPGLRLVRIIERHWVKAFTCITEAAERSFFSSSRLYDEDTRLGRHNHFTIYNALPRQFAARRQAVARDFSRPPVVGVVSRLERIKGMDMVVPAFALVHESYPGARLVVVGDGSLRGEMQRQAAELGVAGCVEWAGRQPQDVLPGWYGRMDVVLMPSRSEGFGLTAIEAMAYGCVVVASRTGGLPEVVRDHEVGLLHEPGSVDDIARKVCSLLADRELMRKLSGNAVQEVSRYSFERYASQFQDLYNKLIIKD